MAASQTYAQAGAAAFSRLRRDPVARLSALARIMDTALAIPGTRIRFGADAVLGLAPGVGSLASAAFSAYLVLEAWRLGVPTRLIAKMFANLGIDALVGSVPVLGTVFDIGFRANVRNLRLLTEHLGIASPRV